jgi:hypothetical protein
MIPILLILYALGLVCLGVLVLGGQILVSRAKRKERK